MIQSTFQFRYIRNSYDHFHCQPKCRCACMSVFIQIVSIYVSTLVISAQLDAYEPRGLFCLESDYKPKNGPNHYYVDVTLLGCKYLCQNLHDLSCSQVIYMPFRQSCVLQPVVDVPFIEFQENCTRIELYRRRRITGMAHHRYCSQGFILWCSCFNSAVCNLFAQYH